MSIFLHKLFVHLFVGFLVVWSCASYAHAQNGSTDPAAYAHYVPAACAQAVDRTVAFDRRAFVDTARLIVTADHRFARDTALTRAVEVARACTEAFEIERVPVRDLLPLVSVYLTTNNDSIALRLVSRRLAASRDSSPDQLAYLMSQAIRIFLYAKPMRIQHATWLLNQLDTIQTSYAAVERIQHYATLAHYYWRVRDDSSMRNAINRVIENGKQADAPTLQRFGYTLYSAYRLLADSEFEHTRQQSAALAVLVRVRIDLGPTLEDMIALDSLRYSHLGKPLARLAADYWFGPSGDTIYPRPGRNTLILFSPTRESIAVARRLIDGANDSLDVILFQGTEGHFLGQIMPPAEEARAWEKYYHHDLGFPGTVAVLTTTFDRKPDGRVIPRPSLLNREYTMNTGTIIVDTQGTVRFAFGNIVSIDLETRLQDALSLLWER